MQAPTEAEGTTTGLVPDAVTALILVDMQTGFVTGPSAVPSAGKLLAAVETLITRACDTGALVIHLRNAGTPETLDEPGTPTWQLHSHPRPGEIVIDKSADDGFQDTTLAQHLDEHRIRRLAICSVMSEMCVAATARAALERGYGVVLAHDSHTTYHVPPGPGPSPPVPAALAARAAEWSLGDTIEIAATAELIRFAAK